MRLPKPIGSTNQFLVAPDKAVRQGIEDQCGNKCVESDLILALITGIAVALAAVQGPVQYDTHDSSQHDGVDGAQGRLRQAISVLKNRVEGDQTNDSNQQGQIPDGRDGRAGGHLLRKAGLRRHNLLLTVFQRRQVRHFRRLCPHFFPDWVGQCDGHANGNEY